MKKLTKRFLLITLSLVVTSGLCMYGSTTQAQELDGNSPFKFVVVLQGQTTGSISTTSKTPFSLQNVGILSIGNQSLTASLEVTTEQTGLWWLGLVSIGAVSDADFVFGFAPLSGSVAQIAVNPGIAIALATGGVFSLTDVTEETPMLYNIIVNGT
jgi:hypothetical protein